MQRRFLRPRTLIIAGIIVALSFGIVFASIPYLPHPPPQTLQTPVTHDIRGGTQKNPGVYPLTLQNVASNENFAIGVSVTNGNAAFCVMSQSNYFNWAVANQTTQGGIPFPFGSCTFTEQTSQDTLRFTSPSAGNWNLVAVNTNSQMITVDFTPAS